MGAKRRIDVMLSSTFRDLEQHREAVIAAMNGLQLTPLAQEFDAALPVSELIKASLDKIEAADVHVGLIGSRYGQRPECAQPSSLVIGGVGISPRGRTQAASPDVHHGG
ncbi:MAG TPA: DUF4062 domain-containing protein [Xanthobacteraceae bacterium]|nr:DUF4062 domain-containing protein [Xanthobacteraceae bacterium]